MTWGECAQPGTAQTPDHSDTLLVLVATGILPSMPFGRKKSVSQIACLWQLTKRCTARMARSATTAACSVFNARRASCSAPRAFSYAAHVPSTPPPSPSNATARSSSAFACCSASSAARSRCCAPSCPASQHKLGMHASRPLLYSALIVKQLVPDHPAPSLHIPSSFNIGYAIKAICWSRLKLRIAFFPVGQRCTCHTYVGSSPGTARSSFFGSYPLA